MVLTVVDGQIDLLYCSQATPPDSLTPPVCFSPANTSPVSVPLIGTRRPETRVVLTEDEGWRKWTEVGPSVRVPVIRLKHSGGLMYSTVIEVNNTVLIA